MALTPEQELLASEIEHHAARFIALGRGAGREVRAVAASRLRFALADEPLPTPPEAGPVLGVYAVLESYLVRPETST